MAIGADHLALFHLGEDAPPRPVAQALADAELFVTQMIELEDERIALPAIDAGVLSKKGDEMGSPLGRILSFRQRAESM